MKEFIDKTAEKNGTPLNREAMMAVQGFQSITTEFAGNAIIETNADGHTLTTTFLEDGTVQEVFVGEKTITKTTSFSESGVMEVLS